MRIECAAMEDDMLREKQPIPYSSYIAAKIACDRSAKYRLKGADTEFLASNDIEAFAIIARHDVEDVEDIRVYTIQ
jgi:hypothetical protein